MAVVCLVLVDNRLWTVVPLRDVAWMFWELAISRTGRRSTGTRNAGYRGRANEQSSHAASNNQAHICLCRCLTKLTILGLAGAVVWLGQVALHTGTGVRAIGVRAGLTAGAVRAALIEV